MLIFDIGFNKGDFSKEILQQYPNAKIIGVDGHPYYEELFLANPIPQVHFVSGIVSDIDSHSVPFFICDSNPDINSINKKWMNCIRHKHFFDNTMSEINVRSYTIDSLMQEYGTPDVIKLDIEGAELSAIKGMKRKNNTILFEWCEEYFEDVLVCIEHLQRLGYTKFSIDSRLEGSSNLNDRFYRLDLDYSDWDSALSQYDIVPERKKRWGMIYAKSI